MSITPSTVAVRRRACALAGAAVLRPPAGGAPPAQQAKAVVIKGRAPVSTELLKIKLPRPAEADLPNGLHLMVLEDHRAAAGDASSSSFPAPAATSIRPTRPAWRR